MNTVSLIGYLKENIGNEFRRVEAFKPTFDDEGNHTVSLMTRYWAGGEKNYLRIMPINSQVSIIGHLEFDENFGTIIVVEQLQCLKKENENSQIR